MKKKHLWLIGLLLLAAIVPLWKRWWGTLPSFEN